MDNIQEVLKQAEIKRLNIELQLRLNKNLEMLKVRVPQLYERFVNHQPSELTLSYDNNGYLNIVNTQLQNKAVYPENPATFCQKQVDHFLRTPTVASMHFAKNIQDVNFYHARTTNEMLDICESVPSPHLDAPIGLLLMTGIGIGFQINALLEQLDIRNLLIFEPHDDSFYLSLHTIDWEPIINYFTRDGRNLRISVGMKVIDVLTELRLWVDEIGLHNIINTFIYRHFNSPKEQEFIDRYKKEFHLTGTGLGFLEDEQISLSHTSLNLNANIPILSKDSSYESKELPPAFILGNGPSLDKLIGFIKQHHKNAILFSCGSTTGTLFKNDIQPDYHVEMERTRLTVDWIEQGTTEEYRKDITILGLNTVSPDAFALFDDKLMAKKANDLGEHLINQFVDENTPLIPLCNPTVTNLALACAVSLGFKEIYLLGVDLGMADKNQHHASSSVYSDLNDEAKESINKQIDRSTYPIPGNFQDTVLTTNTLDTSRVNMEILLERNPAVKAYNLNDGALIKGAVPTREVDAQISKNIIDKKAIKGLIQSDNFAHYKDTNIDAKTIEESILKDFFAIKESLNFEDDIDSPKKLYANFERIFNTVVSKQRNPITTLLLRGSLNAYFAIISRSCLFEKDPELFNQKLNPSLEIYRDFIRFGYQLLHSDPLRLDDNRSTEFD